MHSRCKTTWSFSSRGVCYPARWNSRRLINRRDSAERLGARLRAGEETISFDKDDEDTLDFVTAAANLRSAAYGIPGKSRWEVKGPPFRLRIPSSP